MMAKLFGHSLVDRYLMRSIELHILQLEICGTALAFLTA